jgi:hypothetical protein
MLNAPQGKGVLLDHYHQMLPNMFPRKGARCSPRKFNAVRDCRMNE